MPKTYTFHDQNVYVSRSKRIRFRHKTYTFPTQDVYVLLERRIPFDRQGYTSSDSTVEVTLPRRKMCFSSSNNIRPIPELLPKGIAAPIPLQKAISEATMSLRILIDFLCWSLYTRAKVILATGELRSSPLDGVTED